MLLALLILNFLLGLVCLVVARGEHRSRALRLWGWGLLTYSFGIVVTIAGFVQFDVRKVLGNEDRIGPVARVDAEGHEAIEPKRVDLGESVVVDVRRLRVVAAEVRGQSSHRKLVDRFGRADPFGCGPRMQRPVERCPDLTVQSSARRFGRESADGERGEETLTRTEPRGPDGCGGVDQIDGQLAVGEHAQRLRLVAMHLVDGHGDCADAAAHR